MEKWWPVLWCVFRKGSYNESGVGSKRRCHFSSRDASSISTPLTPVRHKISKAALCLKADITSLSCGTIKKDERCQETGSELLLKTSILSLYHLHLHFHTSPVVRLRKRVWCGGDGKVPWGAGRLLAEVIRLQLSESFLEMRIRYLLPHQENDDSMKDETLSWVHLQTSRSQTCRQQL